MSRRVAIVVQRYGLEINGGAEYHARLIAERLKGYGDVEVFSSSALDYLTWEPYYRNGTEEVNGIPVHRYHVRKTRDPHRFGKIQEKVFNREHSLEDEIRWVDEEGPQLPDMLDDLEKHQHRFDQLVFFSYRYYHSYYGLKRFRNRAMLVPTAEHDPVVTMRLFKELFHWPGAIVYNSHEEKEMINRVSGNESVTGDIVGVGSEIPNRFDPGSFRRQNHLDGRYILYIGRLDENKGVPELLRFFMRLVDESDLDYTLVLIGKSHIDIPEHPRIRHLGFMSDRDKFDGLMGAEMLVIPSQFESLSMVTLEAWALGKPVLANGRTEVLQGQCRRSNAGLWYRDYDEFRETMLLLWGDAGLRDGMGKKGKEFFNTHYAWPVIEEKYLNLMKEMDRAREKTC